MNYKEIIDTYLQENKGTIDASIIKHERMNIKDNDNESLKNLYSYMKNQYFIGTGRIGLDGRIKTN